ncbi:MAG: hypothetical protein H0Z33_05260 [Bacillaceae bacterium]|nr:hypothetical protein [Bacillaceae bacterium]
MILKDTGIEGLELTFAELDFLLKENGFVRWSWDYDHATYDYKYEEQDGVYYLRITGDVLEGEVEKGESVLRLYEPYIGKAVFPHGIDYDIEVPNQVLNNAKQKLSEVKSALVAN